MTEILKYQAKHKGEIKGKEELKEKIFHIHLE